jgi:DNA-directed RNA polymerase specialized sigma24 family protein
VDLVEKLEAPRGEEAHRQLWEQEWRYAVLDAALRQVEQEVGEKAFQAFRLLTGENRPVEEVADQLDIAPASVYVYKHRVMTAIKEYIARLDRDEK